MTVLDASVAIKWFLIEPETPKALEVASRILQGSGLFVVPELFYFEVFAVVVRKHKNPTAWAGTGAEWLMRLPLRRIGLTSRLAKEMAHFVERGLTGYDAAYAAVATIHHGTWLTFDKKVAALLGKPPWIVQP